MYLQGHVKRSGAGDVAIRTRFHDEEGPAAMAWLVASSTGIARHAYTAEVDGWEDLHIPEGS